MSRPSAEIFRPRPQPHRSLRAVPATASEPAAIRPSRHAHPPGFVPAVPLLPGSSPSGATAPPGTPALSGATPPTGTTTQSGTTAPIRPDEKRRTATAARRIPGDITQVRLLFRYAVIILADGLPVVIGSRVARDGNRNLPLVEQELDKHAAFGVAVEYQLYIAGHRRNPEIIPDVLHLFGIGLDAARPLQPHQRGQRHQALAVPETQIGHDAPAGDGLFGARQHVA